LGFAILEFSFQRHHATDHAQQIADRIAIYAEARDADWPFSGQALRVFAAPRGKLAEDHRIEISGADGRSILRTSEDRRLHSVARVPILVHGERVGTVQVGAALMPSILRVSAVAFISAILGWLAMGFFRGVPLRILEQTTAALDARENELSRQRDELKKQSMISEAALEHMPIGLSMFDPQDRLIVCNPTFPRLYNLPVSEIRPGTHFRQIIELGKLAGNHPGRSVEEVFETRREQILARKAVSTVHHLHGNRIVAVSHVPMEDGGWLATHEDITERCENDARLAYLAGHDPLTELPNRLTFRDALVRSLQSLETGGRVAVHCVDLDHFKEVNDTLGHPIGDGLLKSCVERLRGVLGPDVFLARLGGDEFAIIHSDVEPNATGPLAELVLETLAVPFAVDGHELLVGASIGIAVAPEDGDDPDELLKKADLAMYRAKAMAGAVGAPLRPAWTPG
jgi:diguanylate cyclase (GGDEF)-like protein